MKHFITAFLTLIFLLYGCSNGKHAPALPPELEQACNKLFTSYVFQAKVAKMLERESDHNLNDTWKLASKASGETLQQAQIIGCKTDLW